MKRLKNGFNYLNMVFGWINEKRETMQIEFTKQEKELGVYYYNRGLIDAQLPILFMSWKFLLSFRGSRIVF